MILCLAQGLATIKDCLVPECIIKAMLFYSVSNVIEVP